MADSVPDALLDAMTLEEQASLLAGLATGIGAIPVLFMRRPAERLMAPMLGLAGGLMLAAWRPRPEIACTQWVHRGGPSSARVAMPCSCINKRCTHCVAATAPHARFTDSTR